MQLFLNPVKRGVKLMSEKNYREAYGLFSSLVEKKMHLADAHFYLGACSFELRDFVKAKVNLHQALELNSSPERIAEILEYTNWRMVSSWKFYNSYHVFSPDGSRLAYVCAKQDSNQDWKINSMDNSGIYIYDLASGSEECVVNPEYLNNRLCFSADGKAIAYISNRPKGPQGAIRPALYLINLETLEQTELVKEFNVKYHLFTPDGRAIIFSGWKEGDKNSGIYSLNLETGLIETMVSNIFESTFPSISPFGDKLLYASWRKDSNGDGIIDFQDNSSIHLKDVFTGKEEVLVCSDCNNTFPVFSPDGNKILYLSVRRDTNGDGNMDSLDNAGIYLLDIKSGAEKCIVDDTFYNKFPVFSADGKNLIFVTSGCHFRLTCTQNDYFELKGIYLLDLERKEFRQIMSEKIYGSREPVVSPTGTLVAYTSWRKGTGRGLYVANFAELPSKTELHKWIDNNI
jgi:Tol biopolymer transport system component